LRTGCGGKCLNLRGSKEGWKTFVMKSVLFTTYSLGTQFKDEIGGEFRRRGRDEQCIRSVVVTSKG
jgi:hypothetical protein